MTTAYEQIPCTRCGSGFWAAVGFRHRRTCSQECSLAEASARQGILNQIARERRAAQELVEASST